MFSIENNELVIKVEERLFNIISVDIIDKPTGHTLDTIYLRYKQVESFANFLLNYSGLEVYRNGYLTLSIYREGEKVYLSINTIPPIEGSVFQETEFINLAEILISHIS